MAQSVQDSMMVKQEDARCLEREIGALESQMAKAQKDWVTISQRLEEVEKRILSCYMEIDTAEAELQRAKTGLNKWIRCLYVDGRLPDLIKLMSSRDVSDFIVKYDYMMDVATKEGKSFSEIRKKRDRLEKTQEQLIQFKQETVRLARSANTPEIEAQIAEKKKALADINSEIIAMELPSTQAPVSTNFSPSKVYSQPDEKGYVRTGQVLSGYSSWYGNVFHGRPTASGGEYHQYAFTCAHRTLPFGTWLRVAFRGRSVVVKVNDRGPSVNGRMLDLSRGAAEAIGLAGVQWVDCEIVVPQGS